jgi:hypothetical protein
MSRLVLLYRCLLWQLRGIRKKKHELFIFDNSCFLCYKYVHIDPLQTIQYPVLALNPHI